jgi:electron transport complex protein RnfD
LIVRKIITWHIPVSILVTVLIITSIAYLTDPDKFANPLYHLLGGGLLLGAIFMATDYVTSPMSDKGKLIYGFGIGLLTVIIRLWGSYPEGMSFAILIMNALTPIINKYVKPTRFGVVKTK